VQIMKIVNPNMKSGSNINNPRTIRTMPMIKPDNAILLKRSASEIFSCSSFFFLLNVNQFLCFDTVRNDSQMRVRLELSRIPNLSGNK